MPSHYAQLFAGGASPLLARPPLDDVKDPTLPVFDLFTSPDVDSALQRLLAFWHERGQDDAVDGDLGLVSSEKREYVAPVVDVDSFDPHSRLVGRPPPPRRSEASRIRIRKQPLSPSHRVAFTRQGTLADPPPPFSSNPTSPPDSPPRARGPAWWLDVLCPTAADMHRLRKIFPLHPLTIEDVLHQDMREKLEVFDALGYYLVSFRALDEGYFRYTDRGGEEEEEGEGPTVGKEEDALRDDGTKASAASVKSARTVRSGTQKPRRPGTTAAAQRRRAKVEIIEPLGFRGLVEGAGAGAVNMYLVVFGDGIISVRPIPPVREDIELTAGPVSFPGHAEARRPGPVAHPAARFPRPRLPSCVPLLRPRERKEADAVAHQTGSRTG